MKGGTQLLLLAVLVLQARCQQNPKVTISPTLGEIYSGDLLYLSCDGSTSGSGVKWYINNEQITQTNKTWRIAVASATDSGSYQCESNGQKSEKVSISVLGYLPIASLTIATGQPVMRVGDSVILQLHNEKGLEGWNCWVYRGDKTIKILLQVANDSVSLDFETNELNVPETIFWCSAKNQLRSNQITLRTSKNQVSLEMYPFPAVVGESLTLRCLVWGTDRIGHTVFYKDKDILTSNGPYYKIPDVTESAKGIYKCISSFKYMAQTAGPSHREDSDYQDVPVHVPPVRASISENIGMTCSCSQCPSESSFHWYHKSADDQPWSTMASHQSFLMPSADGTYACSAVWDHGRSYRSRGHNHQTQMKLILVLLVIGLLLVLVALALGFYLRKRRRAKGVIYEDVGLMSRDKDDKYEMLRVRPGAQKDGEYDAIHPEAAGTQRKEGEYEKLNKEGMKDGVYHTVKMEGAAGGEGGYEALKKEGMKDGVYHTVQMEGAARGEGGYEALKKEGMKDGVYHTVKMEGAAGGEGGYEALKKEGMKDGVYHTVQMEGAAGGEGGYEALKKEGMKEEQYHTLGIEGAGGGHEGHEASESTNDK
uniref:uncharacterized protein n=1 Tax=Semicossyphus pulcher TaxID=241346 RepID=UPI0037E710D7